MMKFVVLAQASSLVEVAQIPFHWVKESTFLIRPQGLLPLNLAPR